MASRRPPAQARMHAGTAAHPAMARLLALTRRYLSLYPTSPGLASIWARDGFASAAAGASQSCSRLAGAAAHLRDAPVVVGPEPARGALPLDVLPHPAARQTQDTRADSGRLRRTCWLASTPASIVTPLLPPRPTSSAPARRSAAISRLLSALLSFDPSFRSFGYEYLLHRAGEDGWAGEPVAAGCCSCACGHLCERHRVAQVRAFRRGKTLACRNLSIRCNSSEDNRVRHLVLLTPSDQDVAAVFHQVAELYSNSSRVQVRVRPFAWRSSGERPAIFATLHRRQMGL